jgi:ornithine carbamoyltransferase
MSKRDLLNFHGLSRREFDGILTLASELKRKQKRGVAHRLLAGKGLALVFEKPSLRTRATFAVGMTQLGGEAVYLGPAEVGLGTRETPADCARNLDRAQDYRRDGGAFIGAGDQRAHG